MKFRRKPFKRRLFYVVVIAIIIGLAVWRWPGSNKSANTTTKNPAITSSATAISHPNSGTRSIISPQPASFNKLLYPIDQASSLWVVVNKGRVLPSSYAPQPSTSYGLRSEAGQALQQLFAAAHASGRDLSVTSGYRSYATQQLVYSNYVKQYGQAQADTFSARPGHSEHQTGLAVDVQPISGKCALDQCFASTSEGQWLAANAYSYGFIIRYPRDAEAKTGYEYEPWHIRYVGTALAAELHRNGQTMEEFFGLQIYQNYPAENLQLK